MSSVTPDNRYKIGIFGSDISEIKVLLPKLQILGKYLAQKNVIVLTGACKGVPDAVAKVAHQHGAELWGFSPGSDTNGQKQIFPEVDISQFDKITYVPVSFPFKDQKRACGKYRNVISTATCDAGIIIAGRWGTLNEFTNLYDMEKVIGVLTGTGGVADELQYLCSKINKPNKAKVIFDSDPAKLVDQVMKELNKRSED